MSQFDHDKWNDRYRAQLPGAITPPTELFEIAQRYLPKAGQALDIAGGTGRNSRPLLERGLQVTLTDISPIALELAKQSAWAAGHDLTTMEIDFELDPFPAGPWDVIVQVCFLDRALFPKFASTLAPGGLLLIAQPSAQNLERHPRPPRPFLLESREVLTLTAGLEILHYTEDWQSCGRHEAQLIARRV